MPGPPKVWALDHGVARHDQLTFNTQDRTIVSGAKTRGLRLGELREYPPQHPTLTQFTHGQVDTFAVAHSPKLS